MNQYKPSDELQDQLIESLLQSAYESETAATDHDLNITAVLNRIDAESSTSSTLLAAPDRSTNSTGLGTADIPKRQRGRLPKWVPLTFAAVALLAIVFAFPFLGSDSSGQALAAVQRSIAASKESVLRHYRISKTRNLKSGEEKTTQSDLYVEGTDKFVLRYPAIKPNADVWLGSDGKEAWFVPTWGPIRVGNETSLGKWLTKREKMNSPILQIDTILARLEKGYTLIQQKDEVLTTASGSKFNCQHLVGNLNLKDKDHLPTTIELWCDKDSGVAIRLKADHSTLTDRWNSASTTIEFAGEPELAEDWFQPKGHYQGFRRTLRFESEEETDSTQDSESGPTDEGS